MSQFNFYNKQKQSREDQGANKSKEKKVDHLAPMTPEMTKTMVLESYDKYFQMSTSDLRLKDYDIEIKYFGDQFLKRLGELQKLGELSEKNKGEIERLNRELDSLDNEKERSKAERNKYLQDQLGQLYSRFPEIYEMIIGDGPPSRETLLSVLDAYLKTTTGGEDKMTVLKENFENMRRQFGLPADFFDYSKLSQY